MQNKEKGRSENPEKSSECLINKNFNKMKKTLLALGAVVALTFGLASCGSTDCVCTVTMEDESIALFTDDNPTFSDYDGDCSDIVASELPAEFAEWRNIEELGGKLTCEED